MMSRTWHRCQPIDLHRMARNYFLNAKKIELQMLARELGISRATAYRWAGSTEQLIGDVVASLLVDAIDELEGETETLSGVERIVAVMDGLLQRTTEHVSLVRYIKHNPRQGLKVLASDGGVVRPKLMDRIELLLLREKDRCHIEIAASAAQAAAVLVRLFESYAYNDPIVGEAAEPEGFSAAVTLVLSA